MGRTAIWKSIADTISAEIAEGHYAPGDKLPTEAQLSQRFGVNRHTIRHAFEDLAARGLVYARRGAGVFVTQKPTEYSLGRRVRFHQNLAAKGRSSSRQINAVETRACDAAEASALKLQLGANVHVVDGVSFSDGLPIAAFRSVFPAEILPGFDQAIRETTSITAALLACGISDYTRVETRITAKLAKPVIALALRIAEGAPVLRTVAVNADDRGRPIEYGKTWFAGDRLTLIVSPEV